MRSLTLLATLLLSTLSFSQDSDKPKLVNLFHKLAPNYYIYPNEVGEYIFEIDSDVKVETCNQTAKVTLTTKVVFSHNFCPFDGIGYKKTETKTADELEVVGSYKLYMYTRNEPKPENYACLLWGSAGITDTFDFTFYLDTAFPYDLQRKITKKLNYKTEDGKEVQFTTSLLSRKNEFQANKNNQTASVKQFVGSNCNVFNSFTITNKKSPDEKVYFSKYNLDGFYRVASSHNLNKFSKKETSSLLNASFGTFKRKCKKAFTNAVSNNQNIEVSEGCFKKIETFSLN